MHLGRCSFGQGSSLLWTHTLRPFYNRPICANPGALGPCKFYKFWSKKFQPFETGCYFSYERHCHSDFGTHSAKIKSVVAHFTACVKLRLLAKITILDVGFSLHFNETISAHGSFYYCLYIMRNSYRLEVYVCVLLGDCKQKDCCRPAAEHLYIGNAQV